MSRLGILQEALKEKSILSLNKTTRLKLCDLYLDRLAHFAISPPPPDWDGAFTFTTK